MHPTNQIPLTLLALALQAGCGNASGADVPEIRWEKRVLTKQEIAAAPVFKGSMHSVSWPGLNPSRVYVATQFLRTVPPGLPVAYNIETGQVEGPLAIVASSVAFEVDVIIVDLPKGSEPVTVVVGQVP